MADLMNVATSRPVAWLMTVLVGSFASTAAQAQCGGRWLPLGTGVNGGWVFALAVLPDGQLAVGGSFTSAGAVTGSSIARWSGIEWLPMGFGFDVQSLVMHPDGDLIAAGYFLDPANEILGPIARFDGRGWSQIGTTYEPGTVQELAVLPNGDLIASGFLIVGANRIARWDGASWSGLGSGLSNVASAMAVLPNGDLVAGGSFLTAGDVTANGIARWDGTSWSALGAGVGGVVRALAVLPNGDLVAGGSFSTAGGVTANNIARWDGASWSPLGSGTNQFGTVYSLLVLPNGDLVAGGRFTTAGGVPASAVARWDGRAWSPLGGGITESGGNPVVYGLALLPNGEFAAAGFFSSAGDAAASSIARWTDSGIPWVAQEPAPQSVGDGQALTLTASCASGYDFDGAVGFQWKRDGVDIANGPGGASKGGGTVAGASGALTATTLATTLTITAAQPSDSGDYTVVFTNSCGAVTSVAAAVAIATPCPADLNADGTVGAQDLAALLGAWGTSAGDVNGDGTTNAQDLAAMLAAWGACG